MSDWDKFLYEYFKTSGRLSSNRYSLLLFKLWVPLVVTMILEWLIVDAWELANRFPHLLFIVRAVKYTVTAFFCISLPFYSTRRLHDVGKSGWWSWALMVMEVSPVTGSWVLSTIFVWWLVFKDGEPVKNKYGDPPPDD